MSMSPKVTGLVLAIVGVVLLSPDAALTRLFDGNTWTMVFWRASGTTVVLGGFSIAFFGWKLLRYYDGIGWAGWLCVAMASIGPVLWLSSVTIAGGPMTLALLAIAPLIAALGGRLLLGEALRPSTIGFSLLALVGVLVAIWDELNLAEGNLLGVVLAIALPINHAMTLVLMRKIDRPSPWPILTLGSFLLIPIAAFLAPTLALTTSAQIWSIVPMVCVVATLSFACLTLATRFVPASDVVLINMLEPVLGIIFLWWIVAELPTINQWIGGGIVFLAVGAFTVVQLLIREPQEPRQPQEAANAQ